jgi:hypothetical protein
MAALIAALLPPFLPHRHSHRLNCVNNLKQVGLSFRCWSLDNQDRFPMQVSTNEGGTRELVRGLFAFAHFAVMSNELSTPKILLCPQEKNRAWATNFASDLSNLKISYFIGVDATETSPFCFLTGDRTITNGTPHVRGMLTLYTNRPVGWNGELHSLTATGRRVPAGTLGFSDGSVQSLSNAGLNECMRKSGIRNRLSMP